MDCRNCGARLDLPDDGRGVANCHYCGTETLVQSQQQTPPAQAGPNIPQPLSPQQIQQQLQGQQQWAQQQQQWAHHRAQQQAAQIQRQSKSVGIIIAVTTILPLVIGGIVAVGTMTSVSDTVSQATGGSFETPSIPSTSSGSTPAAAATGEPAMPSDWLGKACLVDANGDNVTDLAGLIGEREDAQATIIDGATGEELWRAGSFATRADVFCPLEGWIGVAVEEDFKVDFFPVEDAEAGQVTRTLSDEPREWGAGDGCVSIRSSDRRTTGIALPDGSETDCRAKPSHDLNDQPGMQRLITRDLYRVEHEGVTYSLRERQRGTEFLEVSAQKGGKELWDVPLRVLRAGGPTGVLAMVPTPGTVVVLGSDRKERGKVSILGLDAKTGVERWSRELQERPAVSLRSLHYNGRYVVYTETWLDEMVAVDPASGEQAWRVGG